MSVRILKKYYSTFSFPVFYYSLFRECSFIYTTSFGTIWANGTNWDHISLLPPVIVSMLNHFYQNAPFIVSALKALRNFYQY